MMEPLTFERFESTVNSLDLYSSLSIDLHDLSHNQHFKSCLWLKKGSTVSDLVHHIPKWFNMKPNSSFQFIVSRATAYGISTILQPTDLVTTNTLRVDVLKCIAPSTTREIADELEESNLSAIEVRKCVYEGEVLRMSTLGFFMVTNVTTAKSIAKAAGAAKPAKYLVTQRSAFMGGYQIEGSYPVAELMQKLLDQRGWADDRPILLLQMNERQIDCEQ